MSSEKIKLSPRLKMAADMVRPGKVAADIGTDHAYLPVYLVQNGICPCVIGSDVRPGPLQNAAETLETYEMTEKIQLLLSDGLDSLRPRCASDIILAGMGGTVMARILNRASWIKASGMRLILQPMSHAEDVRAYLAQNGFLILYENGVWDEQRAYLAICAEYTSYRKAYTPAYLYLGELPGCKSSAAYACLEKQAKRLTKRIASLRAAERGEEEVLALSAVLPELYEVLKENFHDDCTANL